MHIDSYRFGHMVIDGASYDHDVIIHPGGIKTHWFRHKGHELCLDDIQDKLDRGIGRLIVGTGASGMVRVLQDVKDFCDASNIELLVLPTAEAVMRYNEADSATTVGAFHLTC